MPSLVKPLIAALLLFTSVFAHATNWDLVWADEFDHDGAPDPAKWSYEEGFVRNKELQYYTKGRLENARVENGMLVIEGRKERFKNTRSAAPEFADYTAASLVTMDKASWLYGRIEVRAKLPKGKGMWPAIWTLGANKKQVGWPACGEIDIMESFGNKPDYIQSTMHYGINGKHQSDGKGIKTSAPYEDFHVYAMEWHPDRIDFFFDDQKYHTFPVDKAEAGDENPFRKPHFLMLNLAMGGAGGGPIDDSALPQKFLIDYVRVYKARDSKP